MAIVANWTANFGVPLLFLVVSTGLDGYAFVPFGVILTWTTAFTVWVLPTRVVGGGEGGEESVPLIPSMVMV